MWITNRDGFFSVVKKDGTKERPFCVRSRVKKDLENFLKVASHEPLPILEGAGTDYKYRTFVSKVELIEYQVSLINDLDYPNFKSSLKGAEPERLQVYMDWWSTSWGLETIEKKGYDPMGWKDDGDACLGMLS